MFRACNTYIISDPNVKLIIIRYMKMMNSVCMLEAYIGHSSSHFQILPSPLSNRVFIVKYLLKEIRGANRNLKSKTVQLYQQNKNSEVQVVTWQTLVGKPHYFQDTSLYILGQLVNIWWIQFKWARMNAYISKQT